MITPTFISLLAYLFVGRWVMRFLTGAPRERAFALINVISMYWFFAPSGKTGTAAFAAYLSMIVIQYILMRLFAKRVGWTPWLAFFAPIMALIIVRYIPPSAYINLGGPFPRLFAGRPESFIIGCFAGISYMAFRSSRLVLEVRNESVPQPSLANYVSFCFFLPTMSVGPISSFGIFARAFQADPPRIPLGQALLRILVGLVKFLFLSSLCNQLSYEGLLLDGRYHSWLEFMIAASFYYFYLYLNFSGFCDMSIGAAGWMGIAVPENFDNPFAARNVKEFWNRWHITLSQYMRDVVFTPLSKYLTGRFGPQNANHAVAATIVVVFLLVGIWHGVGWNFVALGAMHAFGVAANHYYTIGLKAWLGRDRFKAYNTNKGIHAVAVGLTFLYVAASLSLFANPIPQLRDILAAIR